MGLYYCDIIHSVQCLGNNYFCAVGLDRYLRVWNIGAGGRKPVHSLYLKSRLNGVLMCDNFDPDKQHNNAEDVENLENIKTEENLDDSVEILSDTENKETEDDVWDNMIVINSSSKSSKRKSKPEEAKPVKKKKSKTKI